MSARVFNVLALLDSVIAVINTCSRYIMYMYYIYILWHYAVVARGDVYVWKRLKRNLTSGKRISCKKKKKNTTLVTIFLIKKILFTAAGIKKILTRSIM